MAPALASPAFATILLLAAGLGEASRDDGSDAGALEPASTEAFQSKLAAAAALRAGNMPAQTSFAVSVKANLNSMGNRGAHKQEKDNSSETSPEESPWDSMEGSEESLEDSEEGREESPAEDAIERSEPSETSSKDSEKETGSSEKSRARNDSVGDHSPQSASDASRLCYVAEGLEPMMALKDIELCVKQLEKVKEGTLEQGRTSWEETNGYVKALAHLQGRLAELARPEPFEIAFATDQADMYSRLKTRLQFIQADLPKLEGE